MEVVQVHFGRHFRFNASQGVRGGINKHRAIERGIERILGAKIHLIGFSSFGYRIGQIVTVIGAAIRCQGTDESSGIERYGIVIERRRYIKIAQQLLPIRGGKQCYLFGCLSPADRTGVEGQEE